MKNKDGITLISLIITIIILIILAGVVINLSIGENGLFNKAKEAKEKYEIEIIREKVELGIMNLEMEELDLRNDVTIESTLQDLLEREIFESIDKESQIGNIGEYEVKLKYDENKKVVIEYIEKATGVRVTYKLSPIGYTKEDKVSILLNIKGKVKSIIKPDGLIVNPENELLEIEYVVNANGTYKFIIEDEEGNKQEKNVTVDTIDRLAPNDFEIIGEFIGTGLKVTANAQDAETDGISTKSGIKKYEYYLKLSTETVYTKYDTSTIEGLEIGKYNVYAIAYDKAGNSKKSKEIEVKVSMKIAKVSANLTHAMAIDEKGNLYTWGTNREGQLGDGTTSNDTREPIKRLETKFKEISAGNDYCIAIDEEGYLWAWGYNNDGQLGNGTTNNLYTPTKINNQTKFKEVSSGTAHTLAIDEEGYLWAWGYNNHGQLGNGTTNNLYTPTKVNKTIKFEKISAGNGYSMAIDEEGNLWAWGYNKYGLGNGTKNSNVPVKIIEGIKFKEVSPVIGTSSKAILAIDEEGYLWAWGYNNHGQLGNGTTNEVYTPTKINNQTKFKEVSLGTAHTLAIDEEGYLWAWGYNNDGQLGNGTKEDSLYPIQIINGVKYKSVCLSGSTSYAIDESGYLWGWGLYGHYLLPKSSLIPIIQPF